MKVIAVLSLFFFSLQLTAQNSTERVFSDEYGEFISGVYTLKSTDSTFLSIENKIITPKKTLHQTDYTNYIVVDKQPIILFKNSNPKNKADVAGILTESSFVENIKVYYKKAYRDFSKKWWITHEVWKEIEIKGHTYYTDIKLYHLLPYSFSFPSKDQILLFVAKDTGYDGNYDGSYPEYWHFMVIDSNNDQIVFDSGKLDYGCNCEFGIEELTYDGNGELIRQISNQLVEVHLIETDYKKETEEFIEIPFKFTWDGEKVAYLKKDK